MRTLLGLLAVLVLAVALASCAADEGRSRVGEPGYDQNRPSVSTYTPTPS